MSQKITNLYASNRVSFGYSCLNIVTNMSSFKKIFLLVTMFKEPNQVIAKSSINFQIRQQINAPIIWNDERNAILVALIV